MAATALHGVAHLRPLDSLKKTKYGDGGGRVIRLGFPHLYSYRPLVLGSAHGNGRSFITCYRDQSTDDAAGGSVLGLSEIKEKCNKWLWKGQYSINYFVSSSNVESNPPLLLVHGFGASIPHWRRNIGTLSQDYTVYALDLLGFGASVKPQGFPYTMEAWAELILDFLNEVVQKPTVLVGNSVGSLACVIAASESSQNLVRGLVLLNCAGGMNNKAIVDDWRIKLLLPLLWLFDFLLKQRGIATAVFERAKQRENLRNILLSVYGNKESVDDELVEIINGPANDEGALDAFVSIITGPPGPNPVQLMPKINIPVLVLWGDQDPFTPLDGPVDSLIFQETRRLVHVYFNIHRIHK
ncbi:Alpha/beta hydrolase-1 [Corchorus olitorius]|uniref:Alpha/beta hydrolase-1 n=1 Tax=Corchorus olitorius TaxID=93759 RepID=A0A1R3KGI7_9ROSI|nr:Alpha/beta hydrolase-1 [Corchorus olitorius]